MNNANRADHQGDVFLSLWFQLQREREEAEYALVVAIPCDPLAGIACAAENGVSFSTISRDDLRIIFLANELAGRFGRRAAFKLARRALQEEPGCWSEDDRHHDLRGPVWSSRCLLSFWQEFSPIPTPMQDLAIRQRARDLLDVVARERDAGAHYRESLRILEPSALPAHLRTEVAA
jgi:hypothetical protein